MPESFSHRIKEILVGVNQQLQRMLYRAGIRNRDPDFVSTPAVIISYKDGRLTPEGKQVKVAVEAADERVIESRTPEKAQATILHMVEFYRDNAYLGKGILSATQTFGELKRRKEKFRTISLSEYRAIQDFIDSVIKDSDRARYLNELYTLFPHQNVLPDDPRTTTRTELARPINPAVLEPEKDEPISRPRAPERPVPPPPPEPQPVSAPVVEKAISPKPEAVQEAMRRVQTVTTLLESIQEEIRRSKNGYPAEAELLADLLKELKGFNEQKIRERWGAPIIVEGKTFDTDKDKNQRAVSSITAGLVSRIGAAIGTLGAVEQKTIKTDYRFDEYGIIEITIPTP